MSKRVEKDLVGQKFGQLEVIAKGERKKYRQYWECRCECCQTICTVLERELVNGNRKKCRNTRIKDLVGEKFGQLTVIRYKDSNPRVRWVCKCECGKEKVVAANNLINGSTKSCGCTSTVKRAREYPDLTGQRFGNLLAINRLNKSKYWRCLCDCGESRDVSDLKLINKKITHCLSCNMSKTDLIGKKVGTLTVVAFDKKVGQTGLWLCECNCGALNCKKQVSVRRANLFGERSKERTCKRGRNGNINKKWTGYGDLGGNQWWSIQRDARRRDIKFDLTIQEAWEQFEKQGEKCGLTGEKLFFNNSTYKNRLFDCTASLDRIDSKLHYFKENVWWLHKDINNIKNDLSVKDLIYWTGLIVNKDNSEYDFTYKDPKINKPNWSGHMLLSGSYWATLKHNAKKREIKVEISVKEAWEQFVKQKGRCYLTNLPLTMFPKTVDRKYQTASLDRIDSSKNYTLDNIGWVHKQINCIKWEYTNEKFIEMCRKIHDFNKAK